ncbi:MAG: hypothetical protein LBL57_07885, partial [Tannerella sp.]|nr:hypothetical protein [Tannerella sp.]
MKLKWCFLIFLCQTIVPQDTAMDTIVARISALADSRPSETIYLQTSKGIYETGEDLWFRACVLDAQTFALSGRSQTLYLQMIGEADSNVVWQEKYLIENGIAAGHVYVQDSLSDGNYFLEACTGHSFYADSAAMTAVRRVEILQNINQSDKPALPVTGKDNSFRFEMFPEGGNLITGISSKLAFKATDGHGCPVEVKGVLYQDSDSLLDFQSAHAGMGFMEFTPLPDKVYQIRLSSGETYPLSEVRPQGVTLRLAGRDSTFLEFEVQQTGEQLTPFYLMGQLRGMVCCAARGVLRQSQKVRLPLDEFPQQGIAVFTLYDERMLPVAERLVYVHPERKLYVSTELEKKYYLTREKVTVKIKTTDERGVPVPAHLGVSVCDPFYDNPEAPANILTHCYLTSQIRGRIYDPAYYFDEKNAGRTEALDLLLLTQGWRRYIWKADRLAPRGQHVVSDEITGVQMIRKRKKDQGALQLVKISDAEENAQFVTVDSFGHFAIDAGMLKSLHPGYIYLKPMLPEEFKPELRMDDPFEAIGQVRRMKEIFYPLVDPDTGVERERDERPVAVGDVILLDEVTVTGKSRKPIRDRYMGRLDSLLQMNLGPWECDHGHLENYLPGYTHHHDPAYCPCPSSTERHPPVIGKHYELMKPAYYEHNGYPCLFTVEYRLIVYDGSIYSDEELLRMNNLWRIKGYYGVREFYQADEIDMQSSLPDARNTLFWSPSVVTDKNGEATVSFYCSDLNTTFTGR